jgi:hypothetical protein
MTALFNRDRGPRRALLPFSLVALVATTLALLVPTLGTARSQAAPVNTAEPTVSGSTSVGSTLTGTPGTWTPTPDRYKWNWRRCPPDGGKGAGNCDGIVDGPSNTYTLTASDVGFTIRLQVKAWVGEDKATATSNATPVVTGTGVGPTNTGLPAITGSAQVGQTLTMSNGTWESTFLADFSYDWLRCDTAGANCRAFGASGTTYVVAAADMGFTLRARVTATNPAGTTQVMSAQTAVVPGGKATPPPPPPPSSAPGCGAGRRTVPIADVTSPARLVIDRQQVQAPVKPEAGQTVTVRYRVSDTCGRVVQGALVYATAVPFGQLTASAERPTGPTGWATLTFQTRAGFPLSPNQRILAMFVRARKPGEDLLTGVSSRRLFSLAIRR